MDYFQDSPIRRLRNFIQENRRWMYLFQPIGLLLALGASGICLLILVHVLERNLIWLPLIIVMYMIGWPLYLLGRTYNNEGDRGSRKKILADLLSSRKKKQRN